MELNYQHISYAWDLREETPIGSLIKFKTNKSTWDNQDGRVVTVKGIVTEKYPYVFMLDNGRSCTWVEYLLGKCN